VTPYPHDLGIVDTHIGFPTTAESRILDRHRSILKDADSQSMRRHPAEYMFRNIPPALKEGEDPIEVALAEMDRNGVEIGIVGLTDEATPRALKEFPDRFRAKIHVDPNDITGSVRAIREAHDRYRLSAVTSFPAGAQVAIGDRRYYPIYQTCIDIDVPIILNAGVAGPRFPSVDIQYVGHFDQVCYELPELRVVMCHGCEPWEALAVKLMLKYQGLYYAPSAFRPRYYPKAIVDYANTRGADKVMYAGYYPSGLSLDQIFQDMPEVPFREHVWPKFLRENAFRVFKLDA
jgi:predicted TIM-barrel fold metal-dependent hydrolase